MEMDILQMLLGQIPEAIYFSLFMIFTKQLKEKRILFIALMIFEYILLKQFIHFNIWFQIIYTFMTFIILKVLYKEKSQVIDIFTFTIASIILMIIDVPLYVIINPIFNNYLVFVIIERIIVFTLLFLLRNKLPNIQKIYKKLWNRNDKEKKIMKTTTFRSLNVVVFNVTFYLINLIILFFIHKSFSI